MEAVAENQGRSSGKWAVSNLLNVFWLDAMQIRDQVNDAFFKEEGETQPTITIVTKSQSNQSIVITTMPNLSAKYLVEKKEVWKNIIPHQKIYTDEKWAKIVIHIVPIRPFSTDDGLYLLKQEIETFNPGMKLIKTPQ